MKITFLFLVLFSQPASAKDVDTTLISKSEAIEIAKKNGCYIEGADWYKKCEYLPDKNQWYISSQKYGGKDAEKGKPWTIVFIVIDARTGKVIEKGEEHKWGPPPKF